MSAFLGLVLGGTALAGGKDLGARRVPWFGLVSKLTNAVLQYRIGEFWVEKRFARLLLLLAGADQSRTTVAFHANGEPGAMTAG